MAIKLVCKRQHYWPCLVLYPRILFTSSSAIVVVVVVAIIHPTLKQNGLLLV